MNWIMSVKPGAPVGEKWALHYMPSGVFDSETETLQGFETAFDAWAFLFIHTGIDYSQHTAGNEWTLKPPKKRMKQIMMMI